jgi:hypothetical protein
MDNVDKLLVALGVFGVMAMVALGVVAVVERRQTNRDFKVFIQCVVERSYACEAQCTGNKKELMCIEACILATDCADMTRRKVDSVR